MKTAITFVWKRGILPPVFCFWTWSARCTDDWSDRCLKKDWIVTCQELTMIAVNPLCARDGCIKPIGFLDLLAVWFMQILVDRFPTGRIRPSLSDLGWLELTFTVPEQSWTAIISIDPFHIYSSVNLGDIPKHSPLHILYASLRA